MSQRTQTIVIQPSGLGRRIVTLLGWLGFIGCLAALVTQYMLHSRYHDLTWASPERFHSGNARATDKIAIIRVSGVIMSGDGFVKRQIDWVRKDENVKAVVLRVDSPGGTVTGSDYIYHHLKKLKEERDIPLVVSMGSVAASGGYYVSMAVGDQDNSIFAEPTTSTGSIGVIIPHYDLSGFLAEHSIKDDSIASHPRKQMLTMTRPIPEEHREILQRYVDESFDRFKMIVQEGRPAFQHDEDLLEQLATGEIFSATQAKKHGLVDSIGFIEDAIARAAELAEVPAEEMRVVRFTAPAVGLLDLPFMSQSAEQRSLDVLLELSTPRAYYLNTTLPPLHASWK